MERVTRKDAERAFGRLIAAIGGRVAEKYNDVGAYAFDYSATYGGCVIHLIIKEGGGVSCPFGMTRQTPREFVQSVRFVLDALRIVTPPVAIKDAA